MSDRDDKLISVKLEEENKKFTVLKNSFIQLCETEENLCKNMKEANSLLKKFNDNDNKTNEKMFNIFNTSIDEIEKKRNDHVKKMNDEVIPAVLYYPEKIREFKKKLSELENTSKTIGDLNDQLTRAKTKNEQDKVRDISSRINQTQAEQVNKSSDFENKMADFEIQRIEDNKCILLHFIHSELKFHAKSLEEYVKLYGNIHNLEPKGELCEFAKKYNILKGLNEEEMSKRYNFTPGVTERKNKDSEAMNIGRTMEKKLSKKEN